MDEKEFDAAHEKVKKQWAIALVVATALFILSVLLINWARAEMELTIGPTWQSTKASPHDLDLRSRGTITEAHIKVFAPIVWAEMIIKSPAKFSGSFTFPADTTIGATKFTKDDEVQYDGQVSQQRIKFGLYPQPWLMPYLSAASRTSEWTFIQVDKSNQEKRFKSLHPAVGIGGGVRITTPLSSSLLVYGDAWWLSLDYGIEGGLEYRQGSYFVGAFGRTARDTLIPASTFAAGMQAGVRF